ncbi:NYN domain-containing protein [Plesiomonas shigelloides]|uniref:NYN domain-containing protein n=1 Tax=Plesiomonas shigelloides TaxID=703 RepID=UPI001261B5DE|nr:NYN domain-containing protein [Plesiomonas shigelloides]KAB7665068.1 NYN domain-containing protein [Plesiomonas shigelloides]
MKKLNFNIAVYIDMENVSSSEFVLEDVMNALLSSDSELNCIFAIKSAYGNQAVAKKKLKEQIINHNFTIIDTPKIGIEKNRADLYISLDAFETLYLGNPDIDRYCFLTSDSDFTVIGDRLRKFGKEVWLVCKRKDRDRAILAKSFDNLLFLEDFSIGNAVKVDNEIERLFVSAIKNVNRNKLPSNVSVLNSGMKTLDPSFDISKTEYKVFMNLIREMGEKNYIKYQTLPTGLNQLIEVLV